MKLFPKNRGEILLHIRLEGGNRRREDRTIYEAVITILMYLYVKDFPLDWPPLTCFLGGTFS